MNKRFGLKGTISVQDNASKRFEKIGRALKRNAAGFKRLGRASGRLVASFKPVALAAAGIVASISAGLFALSKITKTGDRFAKMAKQTGLSVKALQEWDYIANQSGVSSELLTGSFTAFTKRMGELHANTGGLYSMLKKVDPEFANMLKNADSNEQAFKMMIEALAGMEDETKKAALAAAAFSRSGVALVQMTSDGVEGLDAMRERAHKLGGIMSGEGAAASEKYNDNFADMSRLFKSIGVTIGEKLIPIINKITDKVLNWYFANEQLVKGKVTEFAESLGEAIVFASESFSQISQAVSEYVKENGGLKTVLQGVGTSFKNFVTTLGSVFNAIGGVKGLMVGFAALLAAPVVLAVGGVITAIASLAALLSGTAVAAVGAFTVALLANPITWIIGGILALSAGITVLIKNFGIVSAVSTNLWEKMKAGAARGVLFIVKKLQSLAHAMSAIVPDAALGKIDSLTAKLEALSEPKLVEVPEFKLPSGREFVFGANSQGQQTNVSNSVSNFNMPTATAANDSQPPRTRFNMETAVRVRAEERREQEAQDKAKIELSVDFKNTPTGTRVSPTRTDSRVDFSQRLGFQNRQVNSL